MSAGPKHEIVIIRRGGHGDHEDHHGGVWKIAFADFMTAMMAFFLVMWLISANDKTRASVARYFNPVKLVDATTQPRGLHDPKKDESGITASPNAKDEGKAKEKKAEKPSDKPDASKETASGREKRLDAALRENPMAALAEIAADHGASDKSPKDAARASAPVIGRSGGAAFRDPFAPPPSPVSDSANDDDPSEAKAKAASLSEEAKGPGPVKSTSDVKGPEAKAPEASPVQAKATELASQLKASMGSAAREGVGPELDVRATKDGLLISLTDTGSFSMFANGSAVPSRRAVFLMEGVAKVLSTKPGAVVVRGFTDNKQFKSGRYDNWHLSLDRAQTAHYMLVRGGLVDTRIASVEGLADRAARTGVDPASPLNRRIEILLRDAPK